MKIPAFFVRLLRPPQPTSDDWAEPGERSLYPAEQLLFLTIPATPDSDRTITSKSAEVKQLERALRVAVGGLGNVSANAAGGEITIYVRGYDADTLWLRCEPVVRDSPLTPHGYVLRRYGQPGALEVQTAF